MVLVTHTSVLGQANSEAAPAQHPESVSFRNKNITCHFVDKSSLSGIEKGKITLIVSLISELAIL